MKFDRIIWGVLLLFVGGVLLLENFDVINFYWGNIWNFWPVFLIILGVNILFNRNNSQTGNIISLAILIITLSILFVRGQEPSGRHWWNGRDHNIKVDMDDEDNDDEHYSRMKLFKPLVAGDETKKAVLTISGGGTSFDLKAHTDSLIVADVKKRNGYFVLEQSVSDSVNNITFKMQDKKGRDRWSMGDGGGNGVNLHLNAKPVWEMNLNMGAGEVNFDLSGYKIRTFNFEGGAAELDIKVGNLLPITDVNVKTGVADIKIAIPQGSGCRIKTKTGLSSKDFDGFTKISEGIYETANYKSSTNKIFINFNGGLSSFEVNRY